MKKCYNPNERPIEDTSFGVHKALLGLLPPGRKKALDLGAGFGFLGMEMKKLGYDVTACDLDPVRIRYTKSRGIRCDRVDLNAKLPYKASSFDVVVSSDVIEHLRNPFGFVEEIGRVTRKGGTVVITTPNITGWYSRVKFLVSGVYNNYFTEKEFEGDGYHISPIHHLQMRFMLRQAGFRVETITSNQYTGLLNLGGIKIFAASLLSLPLRLIMEPKEKSVLEGDILIFKAAKVKS